MKVQALIVLVLIVAGAAFVALNQGLVAESRTMQLPWGAEEIPLVLVLLAVTGAVLLLMLVLSGIVGTGHAQARRRLEALLAARDHEIAVLKANAYDQVSTKIDGLQQEFSDLRERLRERVPTA